MFGLTISDIQHSLLNGFVAMHADNPLGLSLVPYSQRQHFLSGILCPPGQLKHLHNVETLLYCPQAFLSLHFQSRDDVSGLK